MLASPPRGQASDSIDYSPLLQDFEVGVVFKDSPDTAGRIGYGRAGGVGDLTFIIAALADSSFDWFTLLADAPAVLRYQDSPIEPEDLARFMHPARRDAVRFAEGLLTTEVVAAETSPLSKQTLATLAAGAGLIGLFAAGGVPMLVFVGGEVGLLVLRGATAVGGALWEGARLEVEEFGGGRSREAARRAAQPVGYQAPRTVRVLGG